uniref:Protein kinase domain-containing protein n=1 Tax=Globisporangium ultimum (strain ATCC 200006 / CBS 805.95 / DAOM BR144) TaxID=431595 RepID=K3WRS9_GLOUD
MQQLLTCALDRVSQVSTFDEVDEVPDWVISPHELDIIQVNSKSSLHTHEMAPAQWLNSVIKVSNFSVDQAKFVDTVNRWAYLSHPNVVNLFRATHMKHPHTAVFENASYTNLLDYLIVEGSQKFVWQKLHEVALGLKCLHDRGIILEYLNCQHIWVGTDGSAKINGFGIGIHEDDSAKRIQADRWRSPKVLRGSQPSVMSNIYSFA